jgi:transcriptional regulator with XRE-family HTH domain
MRKLRAKGDRTKAIPARYAEPFRERLGAWVRDHYESNQTEAAKDLGMSQAHVSALISGRRSLGLSVLLELYEQTNITPNEWLGLAPVAAKVEGDPNAQLVSAVVSGVAELMARQSKGKSNVEGTGARAAADDVNRVRRGLQGK